jgi:hypothetical protein
MQENVQIVLLEMASLLRSYYDTGWGEAYAKLANYIVVSPDETVRRILASLSMTLFLRRLAVL